MDRKPVFLVTHLLAKCEVQCLDTGIKELDLEDSLLHRALLSNQLIEAGFANFTRAIRR